ncbi:MAG: branched-chain amino acid transporter permease [Firmicutes bacterium]|nr:branched-chain amino acid transporter permease [Bacillota bacterium]
MSERGLIVALLRRYAGLIIFAVVMLLFPFFADDYSLHIGVTILMAAALGASWNLLTLTGQLSLGHAAFYGLGAYTAALLTSKLGTPPLLAIPIGGLVAAASSLVIGSITLRMRGIYLAITTLAFAEALRVATINLPSITNGAVGVTVNALFDGEKAGAYFVMAAIAFLIALGTQWIFQSPLHFAFTAIRENQEAAAMLGIDLTRYKLLAFGLSAFGTGLVGGFYPYYVTYIVPDNVFGMHISVTAQVYALFGGLYTVMGPVVGAGVLEVMNEFLRQHLEQASLLVYGVVLVATIVFFPGGIVGSLKQLWRRREAKRAHVKTTESL